jgi:hypothetical protein
MSKFGTAVVPMQVSEALQVRTLAKDSATVPATGAVDRDRAEVEPVDGGAVSSARVSGWRMLAVAGAVAVAAEAFEATPRAARATPAAVRRRIDFMFLYPFQA